MKPEDDRCEEHGLYLYRTGFGWSCKLGCYYTDDPQKIKDGFIAQYKEELKEKIIQMINQHKQQNRDKFKLNFDIKSITVEKLEEILKLLEE